jgi:hypothetical protein
MKDLFPAIPSRKQPPPKPKKIVRIALGESASQALDETGLPAFAIAGCERHPDKPRRWVIYLAELRNPAAMEAIEIMNTAAEKQNQTIV